MSQDGRDGGATGGLRWKHWEEGQEGGRDGNGCRYLILVQRVSPGDKLNPIRVPRLHRNRARSCRGRLWIAFFIFCFCESAPIGKLVPSLIKHSPRRKGLKGSRMAGVGEAWSRNPRKSRKKNEREGSENRSN